MDPPTVNAWISPLVNVLASLGVLWIMQKVTHDAVIWTPIGLLKWAHRASLAVLAIVLAMNAALSATDGTVPRLHDLAVQLAFLLVVLLSAIRHSLVSAHPHAH
jgi:hypothetical protein